MFSTLPKQSYSGVTQSCVILCNLVNCGPPGSSVHGSSPGKNTGVGCHFLLQGIFPTQGSNPGLPHYRQTLYHLSHQESQKKNPQKMSVKLRNWVEEPALPTSLTLMWTRGFSVAWLSDDGFYFRNLLIKVCVSLRSPVLAVLMVTACMVGVPAARGRPVQSPRAESAPL